MTQAYDGILVVSFGGPEGRDDVLPFLENVLRGRNVPRQRMLDVAEHYYHFGGISPINAQNRALIAALRAELDEHGPRLPIYWGNRNWHPLLTDTLADMAADGVRRALAFVTSAVSSYSGCRQYIENIAAAQQQVGPGAPTIEKLRMFFNHPGFVEPMIERTRAAIQELPSEARGNARILFTAHSIPLSMAAGCDYELQLREACQLVIRGLDGTRDWQLVYQSRSGPPTQPWLEPDVRDAIRAISAAGSKSVVIVPIGFVSDHLEVLFDLDVEARQLCDELGVAMARAGTVGQHPQFVSTIRELILERIEPGTPRRALGAREPSHDICPDDCCPLGATAAPPSSARPTA